MLIVSLMSVKGNVWMNVVLWMDEWMLVNSGSMEMYLNYLLVVIKAAQWQEIRALHIYNHMERDAITWLKTLKRLVKE